VADVEAFVRARYDRGWRSLKVFSGVFVIGEIGPNPDGRRVWWVEM
jgi:hypothetical protein